MTAGAATPGRGGYGRAVDCCIVHQSAFSIAQRRNRRRMCQCQWDIVPVLLVPCPGSTSPFHDRTQCIGRALPWPDQLPSVHKHNLNTGLVAPVDLSPPGAVAGRGDSSEPGAFRVLRAPRRRPGHALPVASGWPGSESNPRFSIQGQYPPAQVAPGCAHGPRCPGRHGGPFLERGVIRSGHAAAIGAEVRCVYAGPDAEVA